MNIGVKYDVSRQEAALAHRLSSHHHLHHKPGMVSPVSTPRRPRCINDNILAARQPTGACPGYLSVCLTVVGSNATQAFLALSGTASYQEIICLPRWSLLWVPNPSGSQAARTTPGSPAGTAQGRVLFPRPDGGVMQEHAGTRGMNHAGRQHTPRKGLSLVRRTGNAAPAYRLSRPSCPTSSVSNGLEQQRKLWTKNAFAQ